MHSDRNKKLDEVDDAIRRKFASEGFRGVLKYDRSEAEETEHWWFIPYGWIGCSGCIVNKRDLYVNWLGSALPREMFVWGHERGIFHELLDFSFAPDTPRELAGRLLRRFKYQNPKRTGSHDNLLWYRDEEVSAALENHFPTFRSHFVWYGIPEIPEIRKACEEEGLRFTCVPSSQAVR
jgi:hypothetical protein